MAAILFLSSATSFFFRSPPGVPIRRTGHDHPVGGEEMECSFSIAVLPRLRAAVAGDTCALAAFRNGVFRRTPRRCVQTVRRPSFRQPDGWFPLNGSFGKMQANYRYDKHSRSFPLCAPLEKSDKYRLSPARSRPVALRSHLAGIVAIYQFFIDRADAVYFHQRTYACQERSDSWPRRQDSNKDRTGA